MAFTVLALLLGVLLEVFAQSFRSTSISRDQTLALVSAQSVMARVGTELSLDSDHYEGEDANGFEWVVDIEPYQHALEVVSSTTAFLVTVSVGQQSLAGLFNENVVLHSVRLRHADE